ncbi:MAG: cytochrome P450 [Gemmatimonadaceae bacterium]
MRSPEQFGTVAFKTNPYPAYAAWRIDEPVKRVTLPNGQHAWLITRYDDAAAALKDMRLVKDRSRAFTPAQATKQPWVPGFFKPLTRNMLDLDAPDHTRLRSLVHNVFTPRIVERLADRVTRLADALLDDALARRRAAQPIDLIREFALPMPAIIIAEMLGAPSEDIHRFHGWSSTIAAADASRWGVVKGIPSVVSFLRYIRGMVSARRAGLRARDGSQPADDLLTSLVRAEQDGDRLSEDELVAMVFLLLVAGHETTINLIGNGVLALLQHPAELDRLRSEPALIGTAVEELLRFSGPLEMATERFASEDIPIGNVTIPRGELVYVVLASANRDERQFAGADELDITRAPNRHLAFGHGVHFCLGAPLARLEGAIAIATLVRRAPTLRLAAPVSSLAWRTGLVLRGLRSLPVSMD